MLTHIDLFSGIGGFALAAQWAGFRTIAFCEIDEYCQAVIKARFGAVANASYGNGASRRMRTEIGIEKTENRETVGFGHGNKNNGKPTLIPDIRNFDGTRFRGATLLTGGFPCQPFSCAGKRRGKEDSRWLWPEMFRIIKEARPSWVLGENVAGIVRMELDQVLADLEGEGYSTQAVIIPACAVNAPHRRDRVWIIANGTEFRCEGRGGLDTRKRMGQEQKRPYPSEGDSHAPDATAGGLSGVCQGELGEQLLYAQRGSWEEPWPEVATRLCRVDARVSRRVDRLKALGNAIVPQVAYEIIKGIAEIEEVT